MCGVDKRALAAVESVFEEAVRRWSITRRESVGGVPAIDLEFGGARVTFSILWAGEGFPADVDATLRSSRMETVEGSSALPLVVASRISPGAARVLEERGISWVDETGRASVHADPGLLVVVDRETSVPRKRSRVESFRWARGTAAVGEVLLTRAQRTPSDERGSLSNVANLAANAGVSTALASRALRGFDAAGWTTKTGAARGPGSARKLTDPTAMLSSWASWHTTQDIPRVTAHAVVDDPDRFVSDRIARPWAGAGWALAGWLALQHVAPFVTSVPLISVYLSPTVFDDGRALETTLAASGLRPVERGARVEILRAAGPVLTDAEPDTVIADGGPTDVDTRRVGMIRLYGDLLRMGARGPDAAEHLRETVIGF